MKDFKFFQKGKPYWLTLSKFGEPISMDSVIVGVSPLTYEPDFSMKRRLIYWSKGCNRHFYGPWITEDNKHFNLPQIDNVIIG